MTMTPYNTDLTRAIKWQQNNAPNIQSIINQKAQWYQRYNNQFWQNWQATVFDIRTANAFGLVIWCIILGLPLDIFDFAPITNAWAFGSQRGNYKDGGGHVPPITFVNPPSIYISGVLQTGGYTIDDTTDEVIFTVAPAFNTPLTWTGLVENIDSRQLLVQQPRVFGTGDGATLAFSLIPADSENYDEVGSNFYGGGNQSVALLSEIRQACQLRYVALVSNGRQQWINQMLRHIFNNDEDWDFPNKNYFYLTDASGTKQPVTGQKIFRADWEGDVLLQPTSRTNFLWPSNEIATTNGWVTGSTATIANSAGPDGTANGAATITPATSGTPAIVKTQHAATSIDLNSIYTASAFVKAGSAPSSSLSVFDSTGTSLIGRITFSWAAGVPSISGSGGSGFVPNSGVSVVAGAAGWYRVSFSFNSGTSASLITEVSPDASNLLGTAAFAYPQIEAGQGAGGYISTTTAAASVTDYTLNVNTGAVVMAVAPLLDAALSWQGTWNWASWTTPNQFGTGDGHTVDFTLTNAPGAVAPITRDQYMEYRVGDAVNLSSQFINLLNNADYGIMPQCAGTAYTVVQES